MKVIAREYSAALRALFTDLRAGSEGAGAAFAVLEALRPRIPLENGRPAAGFLEEALRLAGLSPWSFEEQALQLARQGQLEAALRLIGLAEVLLPEEAGVSMGVLWAQRGWRREGACILEQVAADGARSVEARIAALAALGEVDALGELVCCGTALLFELMGHQDYFSAALVAEVMAISIEAKALTRPAGVPGAGAGNRRASSC